MKFAKLNLITQEGLSLAHYQDGWSMEYGEGGSYNVEVLLNGKKVATVTEYGNGGPVDVTYLTNNHKEVDDAVLTYLKRTDEDYGPNSKYEWCRNIKNASDTEYACFVTSLTDIYNHRKKALSFYKKGYQTVAFADNGYQTNIVAFVSNDQKLALNFMKEKNPNAKKIYFITQDDLEQTII